MYRKIFWILSIAFSLCVATHYLNNGKLFAENDVVDFNKIKDYCETEMHSGGIEVEVMEDGSIPLSVFQENAINSIKFPDKDNSDFITFKAASSKNKRGGIAIIVINNQKSFSDGMIYGFYDGNTAKISLDDSSYISTSPLLSPEGNYIVFVAHKINNDESKDITESSIVAVDMKNNFRQLKIKFADEYIPSLSPCLWQNSDTVTIGHYENDSTSAFWGINIKKLFEGKLY